MGYGEAEEEVSRLPLSRIAYDRLCASLVYAFGHRSCTPKRSTLLWGYHTTLLWYDHSRVLCFCIGERCAKVLSLCTQECWLYLR